MKNRTLKPKLLHRMDAYRRAASYHSVGQIYLRDNPSIYIKTRGQDLTEIRDWTWKAPR